MNIFELRQRLIADYSSYIKSFIEIRNSRIEEYVERALFQRSQLWPEPLIQMNPMFQPGSSVEALVKEKVLHPASAQIFRRGKDEQHPLGDPLHLYTHQEQAIRVAQQGRSYVLTTGTGSGKSLSYIIPIVDYVLRHRSIPGIKAIVVYPMNALANSQLGELGKYLELGYPEHEQVITFRRYTGQEKPWEREEIIRNPPDILLTNYVMLELILTRLREKPLLDAAHLRFLVLDELHTYRGRQGADVALLVRRVRNRLTPAGETLQCVGTSATLASGGRPEDQRCEVAAMAQRIFGCEVLPDDVIGETLVRVTDEVDMTTPSFCEQLALRVTQPDAFPIEDYETFRHDPLASWLESTFGVIRKDGRLVRTTPRSISGSEESAAALLQQLTLAPEEQCIEAMKRGLLLGYEKVKLPSTGRVPFAFRLHQFISKGDTVYSTLEPDPERHITLQYQQFAPGSRERRLFPLVFCRECGQEYYCVRWQDEQSFTDRELNDQLVYASGEGGRRAKATRTGLPGFLYFGDQNQDGSQNNPWPRERELIEERLPGEWKEQRNGRERLLTSARKNVPEPLYVNTEGIVVESEDDGIACHFIPAPFRFCLCCGVSYSSYLDNDFEKLARLSSEGRSTATTILSLSTIRQLREAQARGDAFSILPKMLSFTDNRQDASLQAGHFNDFVEIGLLRSALYAAVQQAGADGLQHDKLTLKVFEALALLPEAFAINKELKYSAKVKTEQALRNVLGYRLYLDLRRGWRITSPNLEQCGLLRIEYQDLPEVCADTELWQSYHELLQAASPEIRQLLCRTLLDYMRRELAIKVDYLDSTRQEEVRQQSSQYLIAPWSIDEDEKMTYASRIFPRSRQKEDDRVERYLSGLSSYARYVRRILRQALGTELKATETEGLIRDMLKALAEANLVEEVVEARSEGDVPGYQLPASVILWHIGSGEEAFHDPLRTPNLPQLQNKRVNPFFREFYRENAAQLQTMQDIHAAEHTAQVPAERREEREEAFRREGRKEAFQQEERVNALRHKRLQILYCSPTMELGVDIAELNVVNMRNIPPTPANYAQRSGRAGRSGQPALVFSYCSTGSSHDQYFFQHPGNMVSGAVTPPRLDLTNADLVLAHVYAIWLAESGLSLGESLKDLLDIGGDQPSLALQPHVLKALRDPGARQRATQRARQVLDTLQELDMQHAPWYIPGWLDQALVDVERNFDHTCGRWRELYRAAQDQRDTQNDVIRDASRPEEDKKQARRLRAEAEAQIEMLTASSTSEYTELSEFYSYRYFASEGFLPGYNFPRLPLSAYIPARRAKQRDEYLSRPRFLAIAEFAPRAIVYHEGSRYIINRSIVSTREDSSGVLTISVKQCSECGYVHPLSEKTSLDVCLHCGKPLPDQMDSLFKLQNVSTIRRDKINSDEEERLRQGYDIRTGVQFMPNEGGRLPYSVAYVETEEGQRLAKLTYSQTARLWRINFGPLRRKDKNTKGFMLDMERGYWGKDDESADDPNDPMSGKNKRVIPYVNDTRNCLLFEPLVSLDDQQMISLQAALKSAIQVRYQLEDNELAAEPLPGSGKRKMVLFYEATEGGAGVLRQLVDVPWAIKDVAREALRLCHFDPDDLTDLHRAERALEDCEVACYHCLMTYANQRDHRKLDRHVIKNYLSELISSTAQSLPLESLEAMPFQVPLPATPGSIPAEMSTVVVGSVDTAIEEEWLRRLEQHRARFPDQRTPELGTYRARPDFVYKNEGLAIYIDGDDLERQLRDSDLEEALADDGYMVVRFGAREQWEQLFQEYFQ